MYRNFYKPINPQDKVIIELKKFIKIVTPPSLENNHQCNQLREIFLKYTDEPKQLIDTLKPFIKTFNRNTEVQHTKSRLCGQLLKKGDKAYKCHNCIAEDNSILCSNCFDLSKHKNHQFERIEVYGGCCDCGDVQKWAQSGFCSSHCEQMQIEIKLDEKLTTLFLEQQNFLLQLLFEMYTQCLNYKHDLQEQNNNIDKAVSDEERREALYRSNREALHKIMQFVDTVGCAIAEQLIEFNKTGKYANAMTAQLLQCKIVVKSLQQKSERQNTFFHQIFELIQLHSFPEKVCDLCITLFAMKDFRQDITIFYMKRYNEDSNFATSSYSHLSSQLFTSHMVILKLVKERTVKPIQYRPMINKKKSLQQIAEGFIRFYYDITYLSKLHGESSIAYFKYHTEQKLIRDLAYFRVLFNDNADSLNFYGLEDLYLDKMLYVIGVMQRDNSRQIYKLAMRDLYEFITSYDTNPVNLYRSQERLFALIVFSYFGGDINRLDEREVMEQFLIMLGVDNLKLQITRVLKVMSFFFAFVTRLEGNNRLIQQHLTLFSFYFKRSSLIFNLDSILIKILIKMCDYYNTITIDQNDMIKYEQILLECGDKARSIFTRLKRYQPNHMCEQTSQTVQNLNGVQIGQCTNYLGLLTEIMFSDLPQLSLMCQLHSFDEKQTRNNQIFKLPLQNLAFHYYSNILKSCENIHVSIKDFKTICEPFFKEENIFKQFVNAHLDKNDSRRLDNEICKGNKFNLLYYKSIAIKVTGLLHNVESTQSPYKKLYPTARFNTIDLMFYARKAMIVIDNLQPSELQTDRLTKDNLLNQLFCELWKIAFQTRHSQLYNFICEQVKRQTFFKSIGQLGQQIISYIKQNETEQSIKCKHHLINKEDKELDNTKRKEKRENKKNQLLSKMNRGAEQFLNREITVQNDRCCVICREDKGTEPLCLSAFLSYSNYHQWFGLPSDGRIAVFNSCGHLVHRQCFRRTVPANRVYDWCSLCKTPINILVPTDLEGEDGLESFKHDYYQVVNCLCPDLSNFSLGHDLFRAILVQIISKSLLYPSSFQKDKTLFRLIMAVLIRILKQEEKGEYSLPLSKQSEADKEYQLPLFPSLSQSKPQIYKIFQYTQDALLDKFANSENTTSKSQHNITETFRTLIDSMIFQLKNKESNMENISVIQCNQIETIKKTVQFPNIDNVLANLSNRFMGQCPNCGLVTNQQAVCLICPDFVTCINCEKINLSKHTHNTHLDSCCFVKSFTGEIIYLYKSRHWKFESIYQDYIGRTYETNRTSTTNRNQFKLVQRKLQNIREDILNNTIELKIRYKQKSQNKVNYDAPL